MPDVRARRKYDASFRRRQAGETRMRMLDAAEALFAERGFAATTMDAIAAAAGVAPDTVYSAFRSKTGVLHALLDVRVGGDDQPIALLDRPGPQAVKAQPIPKRQIAAFASGVAGILDRARPIDEIMRSAAAVDPDVRALREHMSRTRYENLVQLVSWLAAHGPFRGGISREEAAAIVWTLASPEVNGMLRRERGWSTERYATWLADALTRTLLP
ncbi:MAG TPA: helix-turn-helix domain-containing protein [Candidatus Limnocylindrales bacterium]|nr:helix-turn-helix domain-containing protein [Candidatus Limnocylindrales bacterium]